MFYALQTPPDALSNAPTKPIAAPAVLDMPATWFPVQGEAPTPPVLDPSASAEQPHPPKPENTLTLAIGFQAPGQYTLADLTQRYPWVKQSRRVVSHQGWSVRQQWEGIPLRELLAAHTPSMDQGFLVQRNRWGHRLVSPLAEFLAGDPLLCLAVNNIPLPTLYGGPFAIMVFDRYLHRGLGHLTELALVEHPALLPESALFSATSPHPKGPLDSPESTELDPLTQLTGVDPILALGLSPDEPMRAGDYYAWDLKQLKPIKPPGETTKY